MFRRTKPRQPAETPAVDDGRKGRPTPTRKEAEAAAKARARAASDPKANKRSGRDSRAASGRDVREGIKRGDERYLTARDKGPVRRFIRDFVDSRLNIAEFAVPLLFAGLIASYVGQPGVSAGILNSTILIVALDSTWLVFKLKRELRRRFPDDTRRGNTAYALMRALQLRFMRMPKATKKWGDKLPERYT